MWVSVLVLVGVGLVQIGIHTRRRTRMRTDLRTVHTLRYTCTRARPGAFDHARSDIHTHTCTPRR